MNKAKHFAQTLFYAGVMLSLLPSPAMAEQNNIHAMTTLTPDENSSIQGVVTDEQGEPLIGVTIQVKGSSTAAITDIDGKFSLPMQKGKKAELIFTYIGYESETIQTEGGKTVSIQLKEDSQTLDGVVVTAMGILRKEKSLTYSTQTLKSDDLTRVPSIDAMSGLEGKVAGITITPSAGGAGGASKILLRGNQSIMGSNDPLIVVDGVPMTNSIRNQQNDGASIVYTGSTEGGDALSMINPDDIESMTVLKGANAAALYGSKAANGVIMITTKRGKEGKLDISYTAGLTLEAPLLTPQIQNVYGATVTETGGINSISLSSWGPRITESVNGAVSVPLDNKFQVEDLTSRNAYLRNYASNDVKDFFKTGATINNSVSISGGTEKIRTYISLANSHANGMIENNSYNRNTFALRQSYKLWDRKDAKFFSKGQIEASMNYVQTKTKNRVGGGTVLNPLYDLYLMPRNIDLGYYRNNYVIDGSWLSENQSIFVPNTTGGYDLTQQKAVLTGPMQNWAFQAAGYNNPYWIINQNNNINKNERVYGYLQGNIDIWDGLAFQARVSIDNTRYDADSKRYATTQLPAAMSDYGSYWKDADKTMEIYTDYLLSYNKELNEDWNVSATLGYVGHTIKGENLKVSVSNATWVDGSRLKLNSTVNIFETSAGDVGSTSFSKSSKWDQAALATAQIGWKDMIFVDGSYRMDWYREFRQFRHRGTPDHYGYFGTGVTALVSNMVKLPEWFSYLKYRLSYSEVGNSLPSGLVYSTVSENAIQGTVNTSNYVIDNPIPEKTKSFETGIESLFFDNRLGLDLTFYNSELHNMYLTTGTSAGKTEVTNSGVVRNQGIETTISYNFRFGKDWRWRTAFNYSYNTNKILKTAYDNAGNEKLIATDIAGGKVRVIYKEGGRYGDMYVTDVRRYTARDAEKLGDASLEGKVKLNAEGGVQMSTQKFEKYAGNMYSPHTLGWSNNINYKDFSLSFMINGRIGGKVISLTEGYLDQYGVSQRSADARELSDANGWTAQYGQAVMQVPGAPEGLTSVEAYYKSIGGSGYDASQYIYSATNFRLRELSIGYTFHDLLGAGHSLTLSAVGRNLFFLYRDAPTDPDVSLSTSNSLCGFELFNCPSSRSYGFSLKLNL